MSAQEDLGDLVSKAMHLAWLLGQRYWEQADSEYSDQHRKSVDTMRKFDELVDDTRAAIAAATGGTQ